MAQRTCEYTIGTIAALRANPAMLDPDDSVPLVLARVLYTGPEPWTAATSLAALTRTPEPPAGAVWADAGSSAHRHVVLDLQSASARRAFADWTDERMRAAGVPAERRRVIVQQIVQPEEASEMGQTYYEKWVEGHERRGMAKGVKRGVARGRREQGREMVLRLASRKFGAETAKRLEGLVGAMGPEQLVQVGDAVVECDTGDELLIEAANGTSVAR